MDVFIFVPLLAIAQGHEFVSMPIVPQLHDAARVYPFNGTIPAHTGETADSPHV
jgi:hypothetical protein